MYCPKCGAQNVEGNNFCRKCGSLLSQEAGISMYCPKCGAQNVEGDNFCGQCGSPLSQTVPTSSTVSTSSTDLTYNQVTRRTRGFAVASLILGILALPILAIIFGAIVIGQTEKDPYLPGRGMAIAGFVLGIMEFIFGSIALAVIFRNFC